jgi:hypothetical protein
MFNAREDWSVRCNAARFFIATILIVFTIPAIADSQPSGGDFEVQPDGKIVIRNPEISAPVTPFVIEVDLRDVPQSGGFRPGDPVREIPFRYYPPPGTVFPPEPIGEDPLVQKQRDFASPATRSSTSFTAPTRNVPGMGYTSVNPPDTVGDVGPNHFIQSINTGGGADVRIWDKAFPPNVLTTFRMDTLGTGACANGFGDPIVLYDRQAGRWLITEFAGSGNHLCVYVSQTGDPISGGWFAYDFNTSSFPDYPKYAVWATDENGGNGSYIVTANDGGPGAYALNRGEMLVGGATQFIRIGMPGLPGFGIQGPAPADPDGPQGPPSGAPAIIMRHRDTELHGGPSASGDVLELWEFRVNWQNTGSSNLTLVDNVDVADFDSTTCGTIFGGCFAQPNTGTTLFPIREVIMNRLQYYNHGAFESLVGNFVVDVGGNQGGIRWFELRRATPSDPWATYQEGTFSIDSDNRWMAGIAMDQSENIAMGYSVSSGTTFPSLRYTGRQATDTLGVMTQGENPIHAGTASNSSERWGDYAAMGLDPEDDCTFWFTSMDNTSSNWRTQVASMVFDKCGCAQDPLPPVIQIETPAENEVELLWDDSEVADIIEYVVGRSRTSGGPYDVIAVIPDSSPGMADTGTYLFSDTDVAGGLTYYYTVTVNDGAKCESESVNEVSAEVFGICDLAPTFAGLDSAIGGLGGTCSNQLDWTSAIPDCGGPAFYNIYRSTAPGFIPSPQNLLAGGHQGTTAVDVNGLIEGTTYYYVVRALDLANGIEDSNMIERDAFAGGLNAGLNVILSNDFEAADPLSGWTVTTGPGFHTCGEWSPSSNPSRRPVDGSGKYVLANSLDCAQTLPATSASLDSPPVDLLFPGLQDAWIEVDIYYNQNNGDNTTIEIWDGNGWVTVWTDPNADVNQHLMIDVQQYVNGDFQVRFNYQGAFQDGWFSIDNFAVIVDVFNPCSTSAAPASAGSGQGSSSEMTVSRSGADLQVDFDASCGAPDYNLLYGDLANVAVTSLDGSECGLGTSGSYVWNTVPSESLFFIVVGTDADGTESSWGRGSLGERQGLSASGQCGVTVKEISNVCE